MPKIQPFDRRKFARDLRFKHKKLGYSQNETSVIIGISKATYSRIMNEQFLPDIETFAKCCHWLDKKMEEYF